MPSQPGSQVLEPPVRERQGSVSAGQQITPILVAGNNTHFVPPSFRRLEVWGQLSGALCPAQFHMAAINMPAGAVSSLEALGSLPGSCCWQNSVPRGWRVEVPFASWPSAQGHSQVLETTHTVPCQTTLSLVLSQPRGSLLQGQPGDCSKFRLFLKGSSD